MAQCPSSAAGLHLNWTAPGHWICLSLMASTQAVGEREFKAIMVATWVAILIGAAAIGIGLGLKLVQDDAYFFQHQYIEICNVVFGGLCIAACLSCGAVMVHHWLRAERSGKRWAHRRLMVFRIYNTELTVQIINLAAFLVANIYSLAVPCGWASVLVIWMAALQWICWNTIFVCFLITAHNLNPWSEQLTRVTGDPNERHDAVVMDAPFAAAAKVHAPKFIFWLVAILLDIAMAVHRSVAPPHARSACDAVTCLLSPFETVIVIIKMAIIVSYCLAFIYYLGTALIHLHAMPYVEFRMVNNGVRLQARMRGTSLIFFVFCCALLFFVKFRSCASYLQSWLGFLPMQVVMSTLACCFCYLAMPKDLEESRALLQVWLQEFAWVEKDLTRKKAERLRSLPDFNGLDQEPMFCFETAIKMFYFCGLAYAYKQDVLSPFKLTFKLETALGLYKLDQYQLFWERGMDTKCLMGWNRNTIVLCFRGTASFRNAVSDLQAWRTVHPPKRGSWCTRPAVHAGFYRTWAYNQLNQRVIEAVQKIACSKDMDREKLRCYVTGHSLGGALATLAAFDIQAACPCINKLNLSCYTFGAPRTGNYAWAKEFEAAVPNMWHIINDQDLVTRTGRLWGMYKRAGQRVIINARGDLIVRPGFLEAGVQRNPGGSSVSQHLLISYRRSLVAVIEAQFGKKRFKDGLHGILQLLQACHIRKVLSASGLALEKLDHQLSSIGRWGSFGNMSDSRRHYLDTPHAPQLKQDPSGLPDPDAKLAAGDGSLDEEMGGDSSEPDPDVVDGELHTPRSFPEKRCVDMERGIVDAKGPLMIDQQELPGDSLTP
ncbi:hypothetical protein WJX72_003000 [[Myrmecia] bisecta]|uniref:Fungal lipase-type domain-containing protein n=1 Tax=[Myrmecia] bisecta TaxID=41462 RepID=A0AAW1Q696_9CHLO